jgi:hypothetical protein
VAKPGTNATCGGITWNKKPDIEEVKWFSGDTYDVKNPVISSNKTLPITNEIILNYAGKSLSCVIIARNSGGIVAHMATVKLPVPVKPSTPYPSISGISSYSKTPAGTVAQCSASSYSTDDTITYQWGYGTSSTVSSLTNPIGSGPSLTITQSILDAINGKYLICQATATNVAGSASGYTTQSVTGPTPIVAGLVDGVDPAIRVLLPNVGVSLTPTIGQTISAIYLDGTYSQIWWAVYPGGTAISSGSTFTFTAENLALLANNRLYVWVQRIGYSSANKDINRVVQIN